MGEFFIGGSIIDMNFNDYQKEAKKTAMYPDQGNNFIYPTLGLNGEAGEVAEKIKKALRNGQTELTNDQIQEIKKELGDVLWYLAQLSTELGLDLEDVAKTNVEKLASRKERNVLHLDGDNR